MKSARSHGEGAGAAKAVSLGGAERPWPPLVRRSHGEGSWQSLIFAVVELVNLDCSVVEARVWPPWVPRLPPRR